MWKSLHQGAKAFLEIEYATVTTEIRERIQQEHLLFALKFALIGGLLYSAMQGVLRKGKVHFERTTFTATVAWAAVLVAALVDLRIAANQRMIVALGGWVRRYESLRLGEQASALGWETYLKGLGFHPAVRLSGQVLTALLFGFAAALFFRKSSGKSDDDTALLSGAGAALSVVIMTATAMRFRLGNVVALPLYVGLGVVGIALAAFLAYMSTVSRRRDSTT